MPERPFCILPKVDHWLFWKCFNVPDIHHFSMLTIAIPDEAVVQEISPDNLPENWRQFPHLSITKDIGQRWIDEANALVLRVPSAVYPSESNWLINPLHPDSSRINIVRVDPFSFSERLFRK
jgi:RES domain-containing protein